MERKMMSWLLALILLMTMLPTAALAATAPGTSSGTVIYVSGSGDDLAAGDESAPLKTIGAAFTMADDGDTICLLSDIELVGKLVLTGDKSVTLAGKADETAKKITSPFTIIHDFYTVSLTSAIKCVARYRGFPDTYSRTSNSSDIADRETAIKCHIISFLLLILLHQVFLVATISCCQLYFTVVCCC